MEHIAPNCCQLWQVLSLSVDNVEKEEEEESCCSTPPDSLPQSGQNSSERKAQVDRLTCFLEASLVLRGIIIIIIDTPLKIL